MHKEEMFDDDMTDLQKSVAQWHEDMHQAIKRMSKEEIAELDAWEREHVDGSGEFATSDWPGWEARIGIHPARRKRSH